MTNAKIPYPPTPELDKQSEVIKSGKAETVQEFIDWFSEQSLHLTKYEARTFMAPCSGYGLVDCAKGLLYKGTSREVTCPQCDGAGEISIEREGHYDDPRPPEQLMADFFGIDRDKIEAERRAILEAIRS